MKKSGLWMLPGKIRIPPAVDKISSLAIDQIGKLTYLNSSEVMRILRNRAVRAKTSAFFLVLGRHLLTVP